MQKYTRLYDYIHEYQRLVYDIYSKHGIAFLVTYYNINPTETVWDNENLMGGSYERVGELSGVKWDKYLLLPIYFTDEISTIFDGQDIGLIKENETNIVMPSTYNITPYANDKVKLEQAYLRPTNDIYPLFNVTGIEKSTNTDRSFWKLKIEVEQSITVTQLEEQLNQVYTFYEYDKKIHTISDAATLTRMLSKNEDLKGYLDNLYDENSGFYLL